MVHSKRVIDQEDLNQITPTKTILEENPLAIDQESLNQTAVASEKNEHAQSKALHRSNQQRRIHKNDDMKETERLEAKNALLINCVKIRYKMDNDEKLQPLLNKDVRTKIV